MGATNSTANIGLPQFADGDKPSFLGDINGAFSDIDDKFTDVDNTKLNQAYADATYARTGPDGVGIQVADGANMAAVNAAIGAAAALGGTVLIGEHAITASISVPSGVTIRGRNNKSKIILPAGAAFPAFDIDNATDVNIEKLRVTRAGATVANACAVRVRGNSERVAITDVRSEALNSGFRVVGGEGEIPGTVKRVILTRCRATNSDVYGFWFDDVEGLEIAHCTSNVSGLDGVKLRKLCKNVTITGGWFTGATGGDGLDAYAGGSNFTIQGTSFSNNTINGLTIKNDDLNRTDVADYGLIGEISLIGLRCNNNGGNGLSIHRNGSADDTTEPLVKRVAVSGGVYNGNAGHGIFVRARQVNLLGPLCANNFGNGIRVEPTAFDVGIISPQCSANGRRDNVSDGISIAGQRVKIFGGTSTGSEVDGATSEADMSGATKYQRFGLRLEVTAVGAMVIGLSCLYNATAPISNSTTDALIVNGAGEAAQVVTLPNTVTLPSGKKFQFGKADATGLTDAIGVGPKAGAPTLDTLTIGKADIDAINIFCASLITIFAKVVTMAPTAAGNAGLNLPHGVAPNAPANGDVWTTSAGMFVRINGVTKQVTLT